ncbi:MAG: DUF484 family protein [Burkholderiales bacterium]|nr:DUF484 family protein [Burkholderiales bacterium]
MSNALTSEQIADFLRANPDFFESNFDVLLNINVAHPHGGRTVSIPERQLIATREKVKLLESKLSELITFGQENDALSEKIHRLTLGLIACTSQDQLIDTLYLDLLDNFQVPHVAVRFWNVVLPESPTPEYQPVAAELLQFVAAMTGPYCGSHPVYETNLWFGEHAPHLKSYALIPLKQDDTFGLLLLASENAERFYTDMGTVFLTRIGDVFAHCLARHLSLIPAPPSE